MASKAKTYADRLRYHPAHAGKAVGEVVKGNKSLHGKAVGETKISKKMGAFDTSKAD